MKRSILMTGVLGFLLTTFFAVALLAAPRMTLALADLDQANESIGSTYNNVTTWSSAQTFTATKQYLDSVSVYVAGNSFAATVTIQIMDLDFMTVLGSGTVAIPSGGGAWRTVTFADPIDLHAGTSAFTVIRVSSTSNTTSWNASDGDTYGGGTAYKSGVGQGYDLVFRTYGHDNVVPTPEDGSTTPGTSSTGAATVSGNAPAATTSANIAAPTNLKAEYAGADKTVNLSWTKSTSTDITGYKVFRSETKGKGYTKLAQTNTKTLTYADKNVEAGKTYYYIVRAIKNTEESVNSNEISVAIAADGATAQVIKETGRLIAYTPLSIADYAKFPLIFWILVAAVVVLDIILAILIHRRHKLAKKINNKN